MPSFNGDGAEKAFCKEDCEHCGFKMPNCPQYDGSLKKLFLSACYKRNETDNYVGLIQM